MDGWKGPVARVAPFEYEIPTSYAGVHGNVRMRVPGRIFTSPDMIASVLADNAPEQVANVATLPGIVGASFAMPDIHWGYGFPVGGVAATDCESGVLSPGGVGFDINCGMRLVRTNLARRDLAGREKELAEVLFKNVPSGVGSKGRVRLDPRDLPEVLHEGARWAVGEGFGWDEDLEVIEEGGRMAGADASRISDKAAKRGAPQVGSLGSGNHFVEVQEVKQVFDAPAAKAFGLSAGQVCVMIHTGSRGFGHQVATDYIGRFEAKMTEWGLDLPDRQLACAPARTKDAEDYYAAKCAAINFAFVNRQLIAHWVRESFAEVLGRSPEEMGMSILYDVAHNIAKREEHVVDGKRRKLFVHRKGATRAFGPGHPEVCAKYRDVGQPVIIPGSMGTESYILKGTQTAMERTFGSTCHGAGRQLSRTAAKRQWRGAELVRDLAKQGITLKAGSAEGAAEEAPGAYKDVGNVVEAAEGAGLSARVVSLRPICVVKG